MKKNYFELTELLGRMVADGEITEEQALGLLLAIGDGDISDELMPLPPYLRTYQHDQEEERTRSILLAVLAGGLAAGLALAARGRTDISDQVMDWFGAEAENLARNVTSGRVSLAEFQRRAGEMMRQHDLAQAYLGARRFGRMQSVVDAALQRQSVYLQRFVDQMALRATDSAFGGPLGLGGQFTPEYLAQRLNQYAGHGRRIFFEALEQYSDDTGAGWVVEYIAVDDGGTCRPCNAAQGFYLPGTGPYPGEVCLGGGNCRCRRVPVYDPEMYQNMTGGV